MNISGCRKFIIMAMIIVTCAGLVLSGYMTSSDITEVLKIVGTTFMGANLVEHLGAKK